MTVSWFVGLTMTPGICLTPNPSPPIPYAHQERGMAVLSVEKYFAPGFP